MLRRAAVRLRVVRALQELKATFALPAERTECQILINTAENAWRRAERKVREANGA